MRTVQQFISSHTSLADLGRRLARQRELTDQVRALLPAPLNEQLLAAVLQNRGLSLFVNSPVWGSRLRYLAPELQRKLRQAGITVDLVRTRIVPVRRPKSEGRRRHRLVLSERNAALLRQTAAALADDSLRDSLLRLSRHVEKK